MSSLVGGGFGFDGQTVEAVFQDRCDVTIRTGRDGERPRAGGLQPLGAVLLAQTDDAQARAIALLRMPPLVEDGANQRGGLRSGRLLCPLDHPLWRPLRVLLVRL